MSTAPVNEFDEVAKSPTPPENSKRAIRAGRMPQWAKKKNMRLLVGLPVVYSALTIYIGLGCAVVLGLISIDTAKDLVVLLSVPGTLAATVVGFFFARGGQKR
jgi:hypothetical protein